MFSVRKVTLGYFTLDKYRFFIADNIAAKIIVNNRRDLLRFAYSGYGYVCTLVCSVADCKNAAYVRPECALVCAYRAARGRVKLFKSAELGPLPDSHYYAVNFKSFEFSLYRNRLSSAARIGFAELHYLKLYSADPAVLRQYFIGICEKPEIYALFLCLIDFECICGHLLTSAAVDDINLFRAETDCRAAGVHCGVASAAYGYALSDING